MSGGLPAAQFPVIPPLAGLQLVNPGDGRLTSPGLNLLTQIWASIQGDGGSADQLTQIQDQIDTIFAMHGDGALSEDGTLTVTATQGVAFGPFATGADAADLTGILNPDIIADGSVPQAKMAGLATPVVVTALGTPAAGQRRFVTDSTVGASGNFGAAVSGGGTFTVPVWADGAAWRIG